MKNLIYFVAVVLISLITCCTKEQINDAVIKKYNPIDSTKTSKTVDPRPVIDPLLNKYVGTWKLDSVTDVNGIRLTSSEVLDLNLQSDLYVNGLLIKGTIWNVANDKLQVFQYPYNTYTIDDKYAVENDFQILSITSNTLILFNYNLDVKGRNISNNIVYYFKKQ